MPGVRNEYVRVARREANMHHTNKHRYGLAVVSNAFEASSMHG
jgi:hypothetical protein